MMRVVRCRASHIRANAGERQSVAAITSSMFECYNGNTHRFLASIRDFWSSPTSSHCIGRIKQPLRLLFSIVEGGGCISLEGFARISPVFNCQRALTVEAKLEGYDVTNPEGSEVIEWEWSDKAKLEGSEVADTALVIDAVCGILREKPWGSETISRLMNHNFSYSVHVVRKVLKSAPVEAALQFFHWLKSQGFKHDFSTYHTMIDALGEGRCLDKMKELVVEMHEAGYLLRLMLYRDVLYWCACAGDTTGVFSYWKDMKDAHIKPSASIYTTLIAVHAKEKQYEAAIKMYSEMVEAGLMLNSRTFSIFIDHLVDLGRLDAATMIISEIKKLKMFPIMSTYAHLMAAYAKTSNMEVVKNMGKDLRNVCDRPGDKFWAAVDSLLQEGMKKEAMIFAGEVWPELSVKERKENIWKLQHTDSVPAVDESKQTISFLQMEKILKNWDSTTLSLLKQANVHWSNDAIYELLSKRIQKPLIAWNFFLWLKHQAEVQLDVFNQITMLRILSKSKNFSSLVSLLSDMQREQVKLSINIFNVIIKDCGFAKNAKLAFWVFGYIAKFKLEPDKESFIALMHAYTRDKCHDEAFALFGMMQQAGYMPDSRTCVALINSLGFSGKTDKAEEVFQTLADSGGDLTAEAYTALINCYKHVGNVKLAFQTFQNMIQAGVVPLTDTLRSMAWVCLQVGDLEQLQEFMKQTGETHSAHQRILIHRKEVLMLIKEVLVQNLVQQRELSCPEFDRKKIECVEDGPATT